jgi:hypothetical protein
VGVSQGNTFKYSVKYFWTSTNPSDTPPANWVEANTTEWYQATISLVTGTTVNIETVQHFLNGSETRNNELIDVATGNGGSLLVIAANLNPFDYLYPSTPVSVWINETVQRSYGGVERGTNHIEVTMTDLEGYVRRYTSQYYDRQTGVLVEARFEDVFSNTPDQTFSRTVKLTESNVAALSGGSTGDGDGSTLLGLPWEWIVVIVVVVVVVAVVAGVLLIRKRKKKPWKR